MLPNAASELLVPGGLGVPEGSNVPEGSLGPEGLAVPKALVADEGLDVAKAGGIPVGCQSWACSGESPGVFLFSLLTGVTGGKVKLWRLLLESSPMENIT
jgi:hypothetical protein